MCRWPHLRGRAHGCVCARARAPAGWLRWAPRCFLPPSVRGSFPGDAGASLSGQSRLRRPTGVGRAARSSGGAARTCGFQGSGGFRSDVVPVMSTHVPATPPPTHTLARARLVAVLKPVKRGAQAAKATRADISRGGSASLKPIAEPTPARDTCGGSATRLSHGPCQCRCRCARPRSVRQRGASRVGSTEQRSGLGPTHPQ